MPGIKHNTAEKRSDPRVLRTRKLLEQAFFDLINERGFQAISIQDITERATVNRATFYAHFEDKYDLLDHFIREKINEYLAEKIPATPEYTLDRLHLLIVTILEFIFQIHAHCGPVHRQVEPMFETAVQEEINRYLLRWMEQAPPGLIPAGTTPQTAALVWSWAIFGTGIQSARSGTVLTPDQIASQISQVLIANRTC